MKTYKVDLDYESYLFDEHYKESNTKNLSIIKEFEYIFFLINEEKCSLYNIRNYSEVYLKHLHSLGFYIPEFSNNPKSITKWWGHHHDLEIEKKLNSKITSARMANDLNLGFYSGAIVNGLDDIQMHISNYLQSNWIIKNPFSFSGIGHYVFKRDSIPLIQFQHSYLLEPLYERVCDIGITFVINNGEIEKMFMVENFNNRNGSFKGGMGSSSNEVFVDYILKKYKFNLLEFIPKYKNICDQYILLGAKFNIQIDSFIYSDLGELKLYPLVEVNYRKTMGLVLNSLAHKFKCQLIEWRVTHLLEYENKSDWIKLSPEGNKFNSYVKIFQKDLA